MCVSESVHMVSVSSGMNQSASVSAFPDEAPALQDASVEN
jgi:hypothetical protein